ncbi:MAG: type 4a pilus biogenesis protein PilO [Candidatus Eisenbacteria bacterium]|nr:type 4a pilus biogenesis protein PilO [Candidatus Eisenbacteria bacterium]
MRRREQVVKGRVRLDLIVAVAILLALAVANATVYAPRRREFRDLADNLAQTENELRYVAGHSEALARVSDYLPQRTGEAGDQRFLAGVSAKIDELGLALNRVEPKGETAYGEYVKRSYKMQIEGDYEGLTSFMRYVEGLSDVAIVESFDCRSGVLGAGAKHRASLEISVIGY